MQTAYMRIEWEILNLHYFQLSFHNPLCYGTCPFLGFYFTLFLFIPFTMLVGWMVHVHSIKLSFNLVLGAPPPILAIYGNILICYIDTPWLNIVKSLNINILGITLFSVVLGSVASYHLYWCNDISFIFL